MAEPRSGRSTHKREEKPPQPFEALREFGVLWAINRYVFHPRGYALAITLDEDGSALGWQILGDGSEPWYFPSEEEEFRAFNETLDGLRGKGR